MKKFLAIALALCMVFALCACGQAAPAAPTAAPAQDQPAAPTAVPADPASAQSQVNLIYSNFGILQSNPEYSNFYYTMADLDNNGRLEIIVAVTEGTLSYTRADFYEVNASFNGLDKVTSNVSEGEGYPEIIAQSVDTYKTADGSYYYVYTDNSNAGSGFYKAIKSLCLKNSAISVNTLGTQNVVMENGYTIYESYDKNGNILMPEDFDSLADKEFTGAIKSKTNFDWFALSEVLSSDRLLQSYCVFTGTVLPSATPAPLYTPQPTTYIVDVVPVVTKDPSSETVYEGNSCQFVSRATAFNSMKWKLVDAYGNVFDAARSGIQGLVVSGSDSPCLTFSNVPMQLNGYSVFAEFYGKTTVQSGRARINVTKAPQPDAFVSASPNSGAYFRDLYNYVNFYSSNGANIHVEATKQGDTGCYLSQDIASGQSINIEGIEGQCITVEVYANVIGSQKVAYFYYTVDRTPAPVPTPDPTPVPAEQTVQGTIGHMESMNTIPVIVGGQTVYVSRDLVSNQGVDINEGGPCELTYRGSYDNVVSLYIFPSN